MPYAPTPSEPTRDPSRRELPGERIDFGVDYRTPVALAALFGVLWLGMLALVSSRGHVRADGLVYLEVLFAVVLVALVLTYVQAGRTVFTTEGVWGPGLLAGRGCFLHWDDVVEVRPVRSAKGMNAVDLIGPSGRVRVHVAAYHDDTGVMRLIGERVDLTAGERLPVAGER